MDIEGIGKRIKIKREELGLNITELAMKCGMTRSYVSSIERGGPAPSLKMLKLLVEALDCSAGYVLGEEEKNNETHVFPNGMTYFEMDAKIKKYQELEKVLNKLK